MGLFAKKLKDPVEIYCDRCGRIIESEEPMAVLAKSPSKGYSGMLESMINKWVEKTGGTIYCRDCFENKYGYIKVEMNHKVR